MTHRSDYHWTHPIANSTPFIIAKAFNEFYLAREGATSISYRRFVAGSSQVEIRVDLSSATVLDPDVLCWCSAGFLVSGSILLTLLTSTS